MNSEDRRLHVVGAGLAGLAAAVAARRAGLEVSLYEATGQAGGRCRSFYDPVLARVVDNGSHLLLGGNRAARAFVRVIGANQRLAEIKPARFPFMNLSDGSRWTIRPGPGRTPLSMFSRARRAPKTRARDYFAGLALAFADPGERVAEALDPASPLFASLWGPLTRAALNTAPEEASARLLWAVVRGTLLKGEAASRPLIAPEGLSATFIEPALAWLESAGTPLATHQRLTGLDCADGRVRALRFERGHVALGAGDRVVLALAPHALKAVRPESPDPGEPRAIVNVHYRLDCPAALPESVPFLGLVGGTAEWLFWRGDVLSATVSAADRLAALSGADIAGRLWRDAARALGLAPTPLPSFRVVKERRATPAQTPAASARRPGARTEQTNLLLAGDWTATGLPATIEGAVRSGYLAARMAAEST